MAELQRNVNVDDMLLIKAIWVRNGDEAEMKMLK